jgi:hypothetical protein
VLLDRLGGKDLRTVNVGLSHARRPLILERCYSVSLRTSGSSGSTSTCLQYTTLAGRGIRSESQRSSFLDREVLAFGSDDRYDDELIRVRPEECCRKAMAKQRKLN